ncbi:MAG: phosphate acyltransferase PlsX [Candidatus Omnitrophica bacterium]|nr:phosphate acyltransferase PlsX [Candidatus Omnitrophota bacterium]
MRIIVDAMGGDFAPEVVVEGVIQAVREYDTDVVLVGRENRLKSLLVRNGYAGTGISVHPAQEVIEMSESAAASIRKKRKSSIVVGINLLKKKEGDAFFSAGNTGAVVCAATLGLGMLPGIERPGIAVVLPTMKGISLLIDAGANIDPKPTQLLQYAVMGDAYARYILKVSRPKVGLLNIGEEEMKGTGFLKETHELLNKSTLNFTGNVEGKDLFSGRCDIILTDGFVGNIALKVSESAAEALQVFLRRHLLSSPLHRLATLMLKPAFRKFKKDIDYAEYGGTPLLGVNGPVLIGHGRSTAHAIKNAIRVAKEEVERQFTDKILDAIKREA